jgi:hypothetical protein
MPKLRDGISSRHVKLKKEPKIGGGRTRDKYLYVNFPTPPQTVHITYSTLLLF